MTLRSVRHSQARRFFDENRTNPGHELLIVMIYVFSKTVTLESTPASIIGLFQIA
jgi:hypothetical protein